MITTSRTRRPLLLAPVVALSCGLLLLAGCSGTDSSSAAPAGQPNAGQQGGTGGGMGANDPGRVSGEIAAVDGKTLQIQNAESQTAVTYTSKTTFTAQVAGKVSDIQKGQCVVVFSSSADENATAVTATSVTATEATDNGCGFGFGGGFGGGNRPSGAPSGMPSAGQGQQGQGQQGQGQPGQNGQPPSGMPSGAPSGLPNGGGRPRSGKVTAVEGDTLTVAVSKQGSKDTTPVTVKTTSDTTVTVTQQSKASAAKVGVCATANGKADDTGAVKATAITLREAGKNGCTMRGGTR